MAFYCPFCGLREPLSVFDENAQVIEQELLLPARLRSVVRPEESQILREWEELGLHETLVTNALVNAVSAYETALRGLSHQAANPGADPGRRAVVAKEIGNSFQNVERGRECGQRIFGFDIYSCLSSPELDYLSQMLQARHILTHSSGIIDDRYASEAGRPTSDVGQRLCLRDGDILRLLQLMRAVVVHTKQQAGL